MHVRALGRDIGIRLGRSGHYRDYAEVLIVRDSIGIKETCLSFLRRMPNVVGPCHYGMARPQVADRGTASDMEGSCEFNE